MKYLDNAELWCIIGMLRLFIPYHFLSAIFVIYYGVTGGWNWAHPGTALLLWGNSAN